MAVDMAFQGSEVWDLIDVYLDNEPARQLKRPRFRPPDGRPRLIDDPKVNRKKPLAASQTAFRFSLLRLRCNKLIADLAGPLGLVHINPQGNAHMNQNVPAGQQL